MKEITFLIILAFFIQTQSISQSCLPDGITFSTQSDIDNFQSNYPNCSEIEGYVIIDGGNSTITNLIGLNAIVSIGDYFHIINHDNLTNLNGLSSLTSVGSGLYVYNNSSLIDLSGLESLTSINGGLVIESNSSITSISGLNYLLTVGKWIVIVSNVALENLNALNSVSSIGNTIEVRLNDSLTSLSGLDNIDYSSITQLVLMDNNILTECEIKSVCNYLSLTNNSNDYIQGNATGCNSKSEVEEACETSAMPEINFKHEFTIYPNPAKNEIFISNKSVIVVNEITIYNQLGKNVLHQSYTDKGIDISTLRQGMYIIELAANELRIRKKLVIEK